MKSVNGGFAWSTIYQDTLQGGSHFYRRAWFENSLNGYIIGDNGLVTRTYDGGASWEDVPLNTENDLLDCYFQDINNGILVGTKGTFIYLGDIFSDSGQILPVGKNVTINPNPCNESAVLSWRTD